MKKKTKVIVYPATVIVHWPSGPVACCEKHAKSLITISNMLGGHVGVTVLTEPAECKNCVNEEVKPTL